MWPSQMPTRASSSSAPGLLFRRTTCSCLVSMLVVEALRFCVQPPQMPRTYACAFQRVRDECSGETWRRPHLGRAGRGRWRGWNAIGDEIPVGKGSSGGSRSSSKLWLCRRGSRVPSTSSFFRLLDVRESRGVPRPRSGGSAFSPQHMIGHTFDSSGRPMISPSDFVEETEHLVAFLPSGQQQPSNIMPLVPTRTIRSFEKA